MNERVKIASGIHHQRSDLFSQVEQLEEQLASLKSALQSPEPSAVCTEITPNRIRRLIKVRQLRKSFFAEDLFSDPAWDILLEAFHADLAQQRVTISGLCFASCVPSTTALRWLRKLEEDGWLVRCADPTDGRRYWVELSPIGSATMQRYFGAVSISGTPI